MKKIIAFLSMFLTVGCIFIQAAPTSYVQIGPAAQQSGGFNVNTGTITYATITNAHIVNATIDSGGGTGGVTSDGNGNTFGGTGTGSGVTSAENTAFGIAAMGAASGTLSSNDTAFGAYALRSAGYTGGYGGGNTAVGWKSLYALNAGWQSTAVGYAAGIDLTDGYENTIVGYSAMGSGTVHFHHSVAMGNYALIGNSSGFGAGNVAIGHSAGSLGGENLGRGQTPFMTGSVVIGQEATLISPFSPDSFSVSNGIVIGFLASGNCHDCAVIGRTDRAMRLGIGTQLSTATARGTVNIVSAININQAATLERGFNYSLLISTAEYVNQYDLSVDTAGVVAPRILQLTSKTKAQLAAIAPQAVGQQYYCSDCTTVGVCISTGTATGGFALITNKGSACN